jgi:2-desacetyl-2-hydroxyethyl bacteriochlorophyllide A dehydrogenase
MPDLGYPASATMRAVRPVDGGVRVVDVPRPDGPGVRVHIRSVGICGTDLEAVHTPNPAPVIIGHELGGVLADGTPVAIEPSVPCGQCDDCRADRYNICRAGPSGTAADIFLGMSIDGGMAEEIVVPERAIARLPPGLDASDCCLVEPLAIGVHALKLAAAQPGMRIAIVGAGALGLLTAVAASALGCDVDVDARHHHQRAAADLLGAGATAGTDYDMVVDTAGTESAAAAAMALLRPRGTLVLSALYFGPVPINGTDLLLKEITTVSPLSCGRFGALRDIDASAAILAARPEIARALITHRFPLADADEAFRTAEARSGGAIKVVVEP